MRSNAQRAQTPEPSHSGRLLLRMPKALHADLAARSDADGVSLNQFIVSALTEAVSGEPSGAAAVPGAERERSLRLALIANAIVVAIAAATAIGLLIYALR
jgi:HicB-like protein involved in pilus formation